MFRKPIMRFHRNFQVWLYSVSHGHLLLRSTKDKNHRTQIDVLFKNVSLMQLPASFSELAISEMSLEEFQSLNLSTGRFPMEGRKYFSLEGDSWQGVIVAGYVGWSEDDAEHFTPSKLIS